MTAALRSQPAAALAPPGGADLARFADFFYTRTGIRLREDRHALLAHKLTGVLMDCGLGDLRGLLLKLRADPGGPEMQAVVNALTINETYFFREIYQFEALVASVLPELTARPVTRPLRLWSMPCATGEEPYSLALYLLENWPRLQSVDVEILGSDIDTRAIAAAQAGLYTERAVSRLPAPVLEKYFEWLPGSRRYRLAPAVSGAVTLFAANAVEADAFDRLAPVDIVFCRNLLIYFDDAARRQVVGNIYDCLRPGGYVFLGHSESMSRISGLFEPRRHAGQTVWRKPVDRRI